ncbi:hypothetical protein UlMin_040692 [Ulmus minor]
MRSKKIETIQFAKKLRSELPRRRRTQISPIARWNSKFVDSDESSGFSCLYFGGEISCESSRVSVGSRSKVKSFVRKRQFGEIEGSGGFSVERLDCEGKDERKEIVGGGNGEAEVSESSCVESNCGAGNGVLGDKRLKSKSKSGIVKEIGGEDDYNSVLKSEISCVEEHSDAGNIKVLSDSKDNEVVSCISAAESCFDSKLSEKSIKDSENRAQKLNFRDESNKNLDNNPPISNSESTIEQRPECIELDFDLACTENFSFDSYSDHSSSHRTEDSESFLDNSEIDASDYTPSMFLDSRSDFSERSEDSTSPIFSLLVQYRDEFSRSTSTPDDEAVAKEESTFVRFEDEEDEESYQLLRNRENKLELLHGYVQEYCRSTEYGNLVLKQRSRMIHWIVERCTEMNLHQETMFLGVGLLDRFLSKGFFKTKSNLQIVGIACLTLATRLEENQPYNGVRQRSFNVGNDVYTTCEVVAMEWLVQEVLNFQCFPPTIHNFLWFYLKAAKADEELEKRAKYLAMLVLSDLAPMYYRPSTVAAAVVILASLVSYHDSSIQCILETHIRTKGDDLPQCIEGLEWLLKYL